MNRTPTIIKLLFAVSLSFSAGLLVFQVPERRYASVPEVWLPQTPAANTSREAVLALPVKLLTDWQKGVKFLPMYPGDPEIVEVNAAEHGLNAAACPNVRADVEASPTRCRKIGTIADENVYAMRRQKSSHNVHAYTERGDTLIVISGVHSNQEALTYLRSFVKVARRDADKQLGINRIHVEKVAAEIKTEKQDALAERSEAYKRLPYDPALPATLPAGWVQSSVKITGTEASSPTVAEVIYKKGRERFISMSLVPKTAFAITATCGPTPSENGAFLPCSAVPGEDYYTGGINEPGRVAWYIYRPVGEVVAVLHTSMRADYGQPLLFSDHILQSQRSIAKSLRPADKARLAGSVFVGAYHDPYPDIKP
jgi:hypothetical protein